MAWSAGKCGRWLALAVALGAPLLLCSAARAQGNCTFTDENGKTVTWPDCKPPSEPAKDAAKPQSTPAPATPSKSSAAPDAPPASAGQRFPYPGSNSASPTTPTAPSPAPGSAASPQPAAAAPAVDENVPAAQRFPFPGQDSAAPPAASGNPGAATAPASDGESSSSSSSSSSSGDDGAVGPLAGDNDPAAAAAAARRARRRVAVTPPQTPDQRVSEDLSVASFYQNDGDYRGAYLRAQDAVSIAPDDPDAHFALAEAARKLGKLDEAEQHYKKCLTLDPVSKERKDAEKALKQMQGG